MKALFPLIFSVFVLISCEKLPKDRGIIISDYNIADCYQLSLQDEGGFAIKSQAELDSISQLYGCSLDSIDFTKQIILVYYDNLPGCGYTTQSTVEESDAGAQYEFTLWAESGLCHFNYTQVELIAVLVPRPPEHYQFQFTTKLID